MFEILMIALSIYMVANLLGAFSLVHTDGDWKTSNFRHPALVLAVVAVFALLFWPVTFVSQALDLHPETVRRSA